MRRHVTANSFAKHIFAEKTFQRSEKRLPLFVGDIVEGVVRFGFGRHRLLDRMSGRSSVAFHCCFLGDSNTAGWIPRKFPAQPDFPLWIKCAVHLEPIHEANPSLSQRLSHQAIVTRSPNHW